MTLCLCGALDCPRCHPGGPEVRGTGYLRYGKAGMTLRDYFASKAMEALIAKPQNYNYQTISRESYEIADAMLAEREKP